MSNHINWPEKIEWKEPSILDYIRTGVPIGKMIAFVGYRNSGKSHIDYHTKLKLNADYGRLCPKLSEINFVYNHVMKEYETPEMAYDRAMAIVK